MLPLYFTLAASGILLGVENLAARYRPKNVGVASLLGFVGTLMLGVGFAPLPLLLHTALLGVLGGVWQWWGGFWKALYSVLSAIPRPVRWRGGLPANLYLGLSVVLTLAAYAAFIPAYFSHQDEVAGLREQYPFESMDERVPRPPNPPAGPVAYDAAAAGKLEAEIDRYTTSPFTRNRHLADLHEQNVQLFVQSQGFGVGRLQMMIGSPHRFDDGGRDEPAPLQPEHPSYAPGGTTTAGTADLGPLNALHTDGVFDFVHPAGFGYVKDRQHVAGFQSHRFSQVPRTKEWEVARLELVSLLRHSEPAVYLSERLPQMDALRGVPTRQLDAFEADGLAALRNGEELHVKGERMLGAVRGVKQCLACHGGERGQLLGAFTYTIRPAKK